MHTNFLRYARYLLNTPIIAHSLAISSAHNYAENDHLERTGVRELIRILNTGINFHHHSFCDLSLKLHGGRQSNTHSNMVMQYYGKHTVTTRMQWKFLKATQKSRKFLMGREVAFKYCLKLN